MSGKLCGQKPIIFGETFSENPNYNVKIDCKR